MSMINSIGAVYADDNGSNLASKRVKWEDFAKLQSNRRIVGLYLYWVQGNPPVPPPNRIDFDGQTCYCLTLDEDGIEVTRCQEKDGPTTEEARRLSFGTDGVKNLQQIWLGDSAQWAMGGPVSLLSVDQAVLTTQIKTAAIALIEATVVEGE